MNKLFEWLKQNKTTAAVGLVVIVIVIYGGYMALKETMPQAAIIHSDDENGNSDETGETDEEKRGKHKNAPATPVVVTPKIADQTPPGYGRAAKTAKLQKGVKKITLNDLTLKTTTL